MMPAEAYAYACMCITTILHAWTPIGLCAIGHGWFLTEDKSPINGLDLNGFTVLFAIIGYSASFISVSVNVSLCMCMIRRGQTVDHIITKSSNGTFFVFWFLAISDF